MRIEAPRNFAPGVVVNLNGGLTGFIGGTELDGSTVTISEEGYYELSVTGGDEPVTYPICVVATASLQVMVKRLMKLTEQIALDRMVQRLPISYPRKAGTPASTALQLEVAVDRPVALSVRSISADNTVSDLGLLLAIMSGVWRSGEFYLPAGDTKLQAVVVISGTPFTVPLNPTSAAGSIAVGDTYAVVDVEAPSV